MDKLSESDSGVASFPSAQKIGGSPCTHRWRMPGSPGFVCDLETTVYVPVLHDRISIESSHVLMAVSSGKGVAFKQAVLYALDKVGKPGMVLKDEHMPIVFRHCYQKCPSQATWEIFQLTLNSEQLLACLTSTSGRQKRHSKVNCGHRARRRLCSTLVHFFRVTICKLSLRVTINFMDVQGSRFKVQGSSIKPYKGHDSVWNSSCMRQQCVQALLPIFRAPGKEANSGDSECSQNIDKDSELGCLCQCAFCFSSEAPSDIK